jgi:hypothetical protein
MSFDWNISSDEEEGFEDWTAGQSRANLQSKNDGDDSSSEEEEEENNKGTTAVAFGFGGKDTEEDYDDDDEVNWEDAEDNDEGNNDDNEEPVEDSKLATDPLLAALKPVTVDWNQKSQANDKNKSKRSKNKSRKMYRFDHLPPDLQAFLASLQKTHLLSLTSHALFVSNACSDDELLHLAHSLIPEQWTLSSEMNQTRAAVPTELEVRTFCTWFFDVVNHTEERRRRTRQANRRAGAPRGRNQHSKRKSKGSVPLVMDDHSIPDRLIKYCSYLSRTNNDDQQPLEDDDATLHFQWASHDKTQLLVTMAR